MRRYRNKKTGAVVEVHGEVRGKNWELLEEAPSLLSEALKDPYAEIFGDEPAKKTPAKPKTSRKGVK